MRLNQWERKYFRMSTFFNTILYNITLLIYMNYSDVRFGV